MRPTLELVTAPTDTPIDLADLKSHLRIDHTDDDTMLSAYLSASVAMIDGASGRLKRALVTQTWRQSQPCVNGAGVIWLELPPVDTVTSIKYVNAEDEVLTTATLADFDVIKQNHGFAVVKPKLGKSWPPYAVTRPDALQVEFTTGDAVADVPEPLKSAIRLLVAHFHLNREATSDLRLREIPLGVDALIEQYRSRWYA